MVCKPWSSKQIISVGLKCGPHRTHSEPEEICWLCEGNLSEPSGANQFYVASTWCSPDVEGAYVRVMHSVSVKQFSCCATSSEDANMNNPRYRTELQKQARLQSKNSKCQNKCVATAVMVNHSWDSTCIWHTDSSTPLPGTDGMAIQDKY